MKTDGKSLADTYVKLIIKPSTRWNESHQNYKSTEAQTKNAFAQENEMAAPEIGAPTFGLK